MSDGLIITIGYLIAGSIAFIIFCYVEKIYDWDDEDSVAAFMVVPLWPLILVLTLLILYGKALFWIAEQFRR